MDGRSRSVVWNVHPFLRVMAICLLPASAYYRFAIGDEISFCSLAFNNVFGGKNKPNLQ